MAVAKTSVLPPVLQDYLPEYGSSQRTLKPTVYGSEGAKRTSVVGRGVDSPPRQRPHHHHGDGSGEAGLAGELAADREGSSGSHRPRRRQTDARLQKRPRPPTRETTQDAFRRQEKEKSERSFEHWLRVKADFRALETERYKSRIALQRELIQARDARYQRSLRDQEDQRVKEAEERRRDKTDQAASLRQVCRQSLDEDRKRREEERRAHRKPNGKGGGLDFLSKSNNTVAMATPPSDRHENPEAVIAGGSGDHPLTPVTSHREDTSTSQASEMTSQDPAMTSPGEVARETTEVFSVVVEEDDDDDEADGVTSQEDEEPLQWYQRQLYELYGDQADYFLHPKIEEKKRAVTLNPKLRNFGGRIGAAPLWRLLRDDSERKLLDEDDKLLSQELKAAFGAFVRQNLTEKKEPIKRGFYSSEDVPDMERLLDQSRVHNAHDFRHKVELMYRSSQINKDRTGVLLHNNPAPDITNHHGDKSVGRYMPSWASQASDIPRRSVTSERLDCPSDSGTLTHRSGVSDPGIKPERGDWSDIFAQRRDIRKARPEQGQPRIHFLTESAATVPGRFSQRIRNACQEGQQSCYREMEPQMTSEKIGRENVVTSREALNARSVLSSHRSDAPIDQRSTDTKRGESGHLIGQRSENVSQWEPLSLVALMEYKEKRAGGGEGVFAQGRPRTWAVTASGC